MHEFFPVISGVLVGLLVQYRVEPRWKPWVLILLSVAIGAIATIISGEIEESLAFLVFDVGQVALVGLMTWALAAWWQQRSFR